MDHIRDPRITSETEPALITKAEAARRLGISLRFLEILLRKNRIPLVRLGRRCVRIEQGEIVRLVTESRVDG